MYQKFDPLGTDAAFHHLGLVVTSIKELFPDAVIITDPIQKVHISFVTLHGVYLELLEPTGDDSPVFKSIQEGKKLVHICYEVRDINKAIVACRPLGFHCIAEPVMTVVFNKRIAWLFHLQYGLIELLET